MKTFTTLTKSQLEKSPNCTKLPVIFKDYLLKLTFYQVY